MKEFRSKLAKGWLSCWLYVIIMISGIILGVTVCRWDEWDIQTKLFAFASILLPLHVLEEWCFPGGFHTMFNLMAGSDKLDRYPMNQLGDMWTNLIGVIFDCIVLLAGVTPLFCVMKIVLCLGEIAGHTAGAIFSLKMFKEKGKRTIYNPGLATTLLGFIPIGLALIISFFTYQAPTWWEVIIGVVCKALLAWFAVEKAQKLVEDENSPYPYTWGNGYFEKFLR